MRKVVEHTCSVYFVNFFAVHGLSESNIRGVPRIWELGPRIFFFRFENLHVGKRHAAHGEAMRIAKGVRGHACSPEKIFKTVQFGAF